MKLAWHEVSELEFLTYLEDIKHKLAKIAPKWEIYQHYVTNPSAQILCHLRCFDNEGIIPSPQPKGYDLKGWVFAKKDINANTYHLLNKNPITKL